MKALTSFKNPLAKQSWSPYLVGAGIGVLSGFVFATAVSTSALVLLERRHPKPQINS